MARPRTDTAERILDVAEQQFAQRGYDAASLSDIAAAIGIRTPSLYSHFKSKHALYERVIDRRLAPLFMALEAVSVLPESRQAALDLLRLVANHYIEHPNLAKLVQYATLAGGAQFEVLQERCYKPFVQWLEAHAARLHPESSNTQDPVALNLLVINFHSMILGYINFAPIYGDVLAGDPLVGPLSERQLDALVDIAVRLWH